MEQKIETLNSRNSALINHIEEHIADFQGLPHFEVTFTELKTAHEIVNGFIEELLFSGSNSGKRKASLRKQLETFASDYINKLTVYANFANNEVMKDDLSIAGKTYRNAPDSEFSSIMHRLYSIAEQNLTSLTTYSITADTQTDLENMIQNYDNIKNEPRDKVADRKRIATQLNAAVSGVRAAVSKMDMIAKMLKVSKPEVYAGYKTAHKVVKSGSGSLALRCKVLEAATGRPLQGVVVRIEQNPGQVFPIDTPVFVPISKKTSEMGVFYLLDLPQGVYIATIDYPGYVVIPQTFNKYDGQICDLEIVLELSQQG